MFRGRSNKKNKKKKEQQKSQHKPAAPVASSPVDEGAAASANTTTLALTSSHVDVACAVNESVRPMLDLVDDLRKIGVQKDLPIREKQSLLTLYNKALLKP